jgi:hypothetical protein
VLNPKCGVCFIELECRGIQTNFTAFWCVEGDLITVKYPGWGGLGEYSTRCLGDKEENQSDFAKVIFKQMLTDSLLGWAR